MCGTHLLRAGAQQCEESSTWVLLMVVPVAMVIVEWVATELSVLRCGCARWSSISTMQRARACAIAMVAAFSLPFRIWLHIAQTRGIEVMLANCTDADTELHPAEIAEWCSFMALDVPERKMAGAAFTAIIGTACTLLYIVCGVLGRVSPQQNAAAVPPS